MTNRWLDADYEGRRRSHRRGWIFFILFVVLLLAARAAVNPLARHFTQRGLDRMEGFRGTFSDVSLSIFALSYTIEDLRVTRALEDGQDAEVFSVDRAYSRVLWRNLLDGTVIGMARLERPRLQVVLLPDEISSQANGGQEAVERLAEDPPKPWVLDDAIREIIPFKLERIELLGGLLRIVDATREPATTIDFPRVEAVVENFVTRRALYEGQPMTIAARCAVQSSGEFSVFTTVDLLADELTFRGEAKLIGLKLADIRDYLFVATDGLVIPDGQLDCFMAFHCDDGHLTGSVKPLLKQPSVQPARGDLQARLTALFTDLGLALFSDRVPAREAAATIIPFDGHITDPRIEFWPTLASLLRNAFIVGLSESFRGVSLAGEDDR